MADESLKKKENLDKVSTTLGVYGPAGQNKIPEVKQNVKKVKAGVYGGENQKSIPEESQPLRL